MSESFGARTQLAGECAVCPKMNTCDHKRMEHLGYIIPIPDFNESFRQLEILDSLMKRRTNYENH